MRRFLSSRQVSPVLAAVAILLAMVVVVTVIVRSKHEQSWLENAFQQRVQKARLVNTMIVNLLASSEAEKSAVMADTDEASKAFAQQSAQAAAAVEQARREFEPLEAGGDAPQEAEALRQFSDCWGKFQTLDQEILPLAVQNTNLKALRLAFVPAREQLMRMEAALNQLMDTANAPAITRLATAAIEGALNLYTLEPPHIAEPTEAKMDSIEAEMKTYDSQAEAALTALQTQVDAAGKPLVDTAEEAYRQFLAVNAQIITLSRQNSNIRSFALSLDQKRKVTAQCREALSALQEAVQSTPFRATR